MSNFLHFNHIKIVGKELYPKLVILREFKCEFSIYVQWNLDNPTPV